ADRFHGTTRHARVQRPTNIQCHPERSELASEVEGSRAPVQGCMRSLAASCRLDGLVTAARDVKGCSAPSRPSAQICPLNLCAPQPAPNERLGMEARARAGKRLPPPD